MEELLRKQVFDSTEDTTLSHPSLLDFDEPLDRLNLDLKPSHLSYIRRNSTSNLFDSKNLYVTYLNEIFYEARLISLEIDKEVWDLQKR
jgi:hypothetical protein